MPAYSALAPITALYPGDSKVVWSAESPATGSTSDRVAIGGAALEGHGHESMLAFELSFSAAPGTFQVDIQVADRDVNGAFTTETATTITTVNASFVYRIEMWPLVGKFVRAIMTDDPSNAVTTTGRFTR